MLEQRRKSLACWMGEGWQGDQNMEMVPGA